MVVANKRTDNFVEYDSLVKSLSTSSSLTTTASTDSLSQEKTTITLQDLSEIAIGDDLKTRIVNFCEFGKKLCKDQHAEHNKLQKKNLESIPVEKLEANGVCTRQMTTDFNEAQKFGHSTLLFTVMSIRDLPSHLKNDTMRKSLSPNKITFRHGDEIGLFKSKRNGEVLTQEYVAKGTMVGQVSNKFEVKIMFDSDQIPNLKKIKKDIFNFSNKEVFVWDLFQLCSNITMMRELSSMDALISLARSEENNPILELAFGDSYNFYQSRTEMTLKMKMKNLNSVQQEVVCKAIDDSAPPITLIQGPPGTGKTSTAAEIIYQLVQRGSSVLVSAPSNLAVDNLLEKCLSLGLTRVVRLGCETKLLPAVADYQLEALMEKTGCGSQLVAARKHLAQLNKEKNKNISEFLEAKQLLSVLEGIATKEVAKKVDVMFVTCCTSGCLYIQDFIEDMFEHRNGIKSKNALIDVAVIDEAGQAIEPISWVPILKAKRSILLGDQQQLPPTVTCVESQKCGLGVSLFERLIQKYSKIEKNEKMNKWIVQQNVIPVVLGMLTVQYRMNKAIMNWSSEQFYDNQLIAHSSVADRILSTANLKKGFIISNKFKIVNPKVLRDLLSMPMIWIDTTDNNFYREGNTKGTISNPGEAIGISGLISCLLSLPQESSSTPIVSHEDFGVITPYCGQMGAIKNDLVYLMGDDNAEKVNVNTIDSFQGRENEVIILSLVRSNSQHNIGFLSECRRLNVAITRAKRLVIVVGDSKTVSSCPEIKNLFEKFKEHGRVIQAKDFFDEKIMKSCLDVIKITELFNSR